MNSPISPYPGLRPFTESEAIFFKGREKHITKIQEELTQNKFLMVTGASGDGKSSLVYAGLLPNVRAGFFRGEFSKWQTAIFRPGNVPMNNLCRALGKAFKGEKNEEEIKEELKFGYTALIDCYKSSALYVDSNSPELQGLDDKARRKVLRKGSNLLIIVDQFEEFFTFDENFDKDSSVPSVEAQLVMNLLVETAKTIRGGSLPIYIICTMRSDYIGNAPSYRGLPELIGDYQYFVPRLTRDEMEQVIREPAQLAGGSIANSLVQRIINDLDEMHSDVLPTLQHAMRRNWEMANNGTEEMGLLHYAMSGGVDTDQITQEDCITFVFWRSNLSSAIESLYIQGSNIRNVINIHANTLMFESLDIAIARYGEIEARQIFKRIFQNLTAVDSNKIVRKPIIIEELVQIIADPEVDGDAICEIIKPFTDDNSSLLHLIDNSNANQSKENFRLDVSHEALIRNWKVFRNWAYEEYNNMNEFVSLMTEVDRWNLNLQSNKFLLSKGGYEHYFNWLKDHKISVGWINRYVTEEAAFVNQSVAQTIRAEVYKKHADVYMNRSGKQIKNKQNAWKFVFVLMFILLISSVYNWHKSSLSSVINKSNEMSIRALHELGNDPSLAFRLARAGYEVCPENLAKEALMVSFNEAPYYEIIYKHDQIVNYLIPDKDKSKYLTLSADFTAVLWDQDFNMICKMEGHGGPPFGAAFLGDNRIVTSAYDQIIRLWTDKGELISSKSTNGRYLKEIEYGKMFVTHDYGKSLFLYRYENNEIKFVCEVKLESPIYDVTYSKKLQMMYLLDDSGGVGAYKYDADSGSLHLLKRFVPENIKDNFYSIKVIESLNMMVLGTGLGNLSAFKLTESGVGELVWNVNGTEPEPIWDMEYEKQNNLLLTRSSKQCSAYHLEGNEIKFIKSLSIEGNNVIKSIISDVRIALVLDNFHIAIWNIKKEEGKFQIRMEAELKGHSAGTKGLCFSIDNKTLYTGSSDYTVRRWHLDYPDRYQLTTEDKTFVNCLNLDSSGNVYMGYGNGKVRICSNNGIETNAWQAHSTTVKEIRLNENYIATYTYKEIKIWNRSGKLIKSKSEIPGRITDVTFCGPKSVVFSRRTGEIEVWNYIQDSITQLPSHKYICWDIAVSQSNSFVASASADSTLIISKTNGELIAAKTEHKSNIWRVSISADESRIVTSSEDRFAIIWDNKGNVLKKLKHPKTVSKSKFSPDSKQLLTICEDDIMRLWTADGELLQQFEGHEGMIQNAHFSHDGKLIASGSVDSRIIIWNLEGQIINNTKVPNGVIIDVIFNASDNYIYSFSGNNLVRKWPVYADTILKIIDTGQRGEIKKLDNKERDFYGL